MAFENGSLFKIWDEGNLQLGRIREQHSHHSLINFDVIKTIKPGPDYDSTRRVVISSKNNVVKEYGIMTLEAHREAFPEDWV